MSPIIKFLAASAAALALLGAAEARSDRDYDRGCVGGGDRTASTVVGAVIGGLIGGQFGKGGNDRAVGAVAGAVVGGAIGNSVAAGRDCGGDAFARAGYGERRDQRYDDRYEDRYDSRYDDRYDRRGYDDRRDRAYDGRYEARHDGYRDSYAEPAYYDAFENARPYQRVSWTDQSGYANYVVPRERYSDGYGRNCREFEQVIYIDGRRQTATGTACRERDGSWRIID